MKHLSPISGISVNQNYVATAGYDNRIILWDRNSFAPIAMGFHDHLVNQCEFSACGKFLLTSSSDCSVRLWQLPDMKLVKILTGHTDDVEFATFNSNSSQIASASRDSTIRINSITSHDFKILKGHKADVSSVQFVNNSLISCSDDGTIRRWNLSTGKSVILSQTNFQTDTVAINGKTVFAGDDAGIIYIIHNRKIIKIKAHNSGIKRLFFNTDNKILISMAYDRKCIIWKVTTTGLEEIHSLNLPNIVWPRSCAIYNEYIYFATFGSSFGVYDYKNHIWQLSHIEFTNGINAIYLDNNQIYKIGDSGILSKIGNSKPIYSTNSLANFIIKFRNNFIIGGQNGYLINATTKKALFQYKSPLNCAISIGNKLLCIGTYTGEILIFENLELDPQIIKLHNNAIKDMLMLDSDIISVCANGEISKYERISNRKTVILGHNNIINSCSKIDKEHFVTVSRDKKLKIWNKSTLTVIEEIDSPHTHSIKAVSVSDDGKYIASGAYNGIVYILNQMTKTWSKIRVTHAGISCLRYDSINSQFIAGSFDGNVYFIALEKDDEYQ